MRMSVLLVAKKPKAEPVVGLYIELLANHHGMAVLI